ncbi:hypothetical protein AAV29_10930 [Bacillus velezensis]|nr:hypothetical protein AAV29_10930 [Bacillus velezensis]
MWDISSRLIFICLRTWNARISDKWILAGYSPSWMKLFLNMSILTFIRTKALNSTLQLQLVIVVSRIMVTYEGSRLTRMSVSKKRQVNGYYRAKNVGKTIATQAEKLLFM